jgi:hypothetical protein
MRCQREGGLSAITQVKVLSPEIFNIAMGQGFHFLEAVSATRVKGECVSAVPGSESMAGNRTVHIGTWESHVVPGGGIRRAEEARRRFGGMAVGLAHSRGVIGVMPGEFRGIGALEGVSRHVQRDEDASAIH